EWRRRPLVDVSAHVRIEVAGVLLDDAVGKPGEQEHGEQGDGEAEDRPGQKLGLGQFFGAGKLRIVMSAHRRALLARAVGSALRLAIRESSLAKSASLPWRG